MSGSKDTGEPAGTGRPGDDTSSPLDKGFNHEAWERRLAAARVQRAKSLKSKGKEPEKRPTNRSNFRGHDDFESPGVTHKLGEFQPNVPTNEDLSPASDPTPAIAQAAQPSPQRSVSLPLIVFIAFASCFGLGAGTVLSFTAAIGMGWISVGAIASDDLNRTRQVVESVPQVQSVFGVAFSQSLTAEKLPSISRATDQDINIAQVEPLYLFSLSRPDNSVAAVKSPGPELETLIEAKEFGVHDDVQTLDFAAVLENSVFVSINPSAPLKNDVQPDRLPDLPEKNNVAAMVSISGPAAPLWSEVKLASLLLNDAVPDLASRPVLSEIEPGMKPWASYENPGQLAVFDTFSEDFSGPNQIPALLTLEMPLLSGPPQKSAAVGVPELDSVAAALPQIGNAHNRPRTLADELASDGLPLDDVYLVAFAPRSLTDALMTQHIADLDETGFTTDVVNRVNYRISSTHVRYYNRSDAVVAKAIAERLGADARDFTKMRNPPKPGRLEIYIEGERQRYSGARTVASRTNTTAVRAAQKERLERSILSKLRRGAHLGTATE